MVGKRETILVLSYGMNSEALEGAERGRPGEVETWGCQSPQPLSLSQQP